MANSAVLRNPYIAGRSLSRQGFYGRDKTFQLVETELASPERNAIVLFGQRRIGKTSILQQLQQRLAALPFLPVYFDLMDRARRPLGQVLYEIAATIAAAVGIVPGPPDRFDDQGVFFRQVFLPTIYQALGDEWRPVLLLDEFDVLDVAADQQLSPTAAARAFFPYLRELMQGEPRLGFVFVVGRRTEDLSIDVKATFKSVRYKRVSVLDEASAHELILTAQRQRSLEFDQQAVGHILALTSGHPYFTQLLCQILWDSAYAHDLQGIPTIDVASVEAAVPKVLEAGENVFEWIWDGLPPAERVIFAAIAQIAGEQSNVTEDHLIELLQSQGIRILTRELELAPATLVEWEMLRKVDSGYRFFVELMRQWVATRKPLPRVKDELDRVVPQADLLYRSGDGFYRQGDLENALGQLRAALRINPNHLKARLLCGKVLVEQGNLAEAAQDLEEAYRYDEDAARYPLINALLAYGEELERNARTDDALKAYERVLKLSPRSQVGQERRAAIWMARAEVAMKADDLATAVVAYREAGQPERALEVEALKRRRELDQALADALRLEKEEKWDEAHKVYLRLTAEYPEEQELSLALARVEDEQRKQALNRMVASAKLHEQREEWDLAITVYRRLVATYPEDEHWRNELVRVQEEQSIYKCYLQGIRAAQARQWDQAMHLLAYVVYKRKDNYNATYWLMQAIRERQPPLTLIEAVRRRDADQQLASQTAEKTEPALAKIICPKCHSEVKLGVFFCKICGIEIRLPSAGPEPAILAETTLSSAANQPAAAWNAAGMKSATTPARTASSQTFAPTSEAQSGRFVDRAQLLTATGISVPTGLILSYLDTLRTTDLTLGNVFIWLLLIILGFVTLLSLFSGAIIVIDGNTGVWGVMYATSLTALSAFITWSVYTSAILSTSALGAIFWWLLALVFGGLTLFLFFWFAIPTFKKWFGL
jgi:tetratricopeptide (TPR) repeat protein